jgi:hypothetical protein
MATYPMVVADRPVYGVVAATDTDQAALTLDFIDRLCRINPWLANLLTVQRDRVVAKNGSELTVLSSDAPSSFGLNVGYVICDELTRWKSPDMWESLASTIVKRRHCMCVIISNAGTGQGSSWQWRIREICRTDPRWHFSRLEGPQASWLTKELIDEQQKLLTPKAFQRNVLNRWTTDSGDCLSQAAIDVAFKADLEPMTLGSDYEGFGYVAGLDLAVKSDHAAFVVLGWNYMTKRIRLAHLESWSPGERGEIDLIAVQKSVIAAAERFSFWVQGNGCYYDPHQAELMAQQLRDLGISMVPMPFVGSNLNKMASAVLQCFEREKNIDLYPHELLRHDLEKLSIVERGFGYKLEAPHDETGHCDRAIALSICLPFAADCATIHWRKVAAEERGGLLNINDLNSRGNICRDLELPAWER